MDFSEEEITTETRFTVLFSLFQSFPHLESINPMLILIFIFNLDSNSFVERRKSRPLNGADHCERNQQTPPVIGNCERIQNNH